MEILEVVQVGAFGSIQDNGRIGFRYYAIPQSGCLDYKLQHISNYLAGNESTDPVYELIGGRFVFKCLSSIMIGIAGIGQRVMLNSLEIDPNETIQLNTDDELIIETQLTCLSISGAMEASLHFDSYSTYSLAGLGESLLRGGSKLKAVPRRCAKRSVKKGILPVSSESSVIRVLKGPEWNNVEMGASEFEGVEWTISKNSNRIGIRLSGPTTKITQEEMNSVPTFVGTIQCPPDGQPIVLMNDGQTTGGYPRIAQVIKADLPRIARLIMGGSIRFKFVTIQEARYIFQRQQSFIKHELNQ